MLEFLDRFNRYLDTHLWPWFLGAFLDIYHWYVWVGKGDYTRAVIDIIFLCYSLYMINTILKSRREWRNSWFGLPSSAVWLQLATPSTSFGLITNVSWRVRPAKTFALILHLTWSSNETYIHHTRPRWRSGHPNAWRDNSPKDWIDDVRWGLPTQSAKKLCITLLLLMSEPPKRYIVEDEHNGHKFEWKLELKPASSPYPPQVTCTVCHGSGGRGHFKSLDDPEDCWRCNNTGTHADPSFVWDPEPPPELVARLRKLWKDYWNEQQNEKFELTMQ